MLFALVSSMRSRVIDFKGKIFGLDKISDGNKQHDFVCSVKIDMDAV